MVASMPFEGKQRLIVADIRFYFRETRMNRTTFCGISVTQTRHEQRNGLV